MVQKILRKHVSHCLFSVAEFSILLPCAGNSGIAQFGIGLMIETRKGKPLNGMPLRLLLRKECAVRGECVSRAHDHHLSTRTHSSVSAVIHRLICCMLLIDAGEAVGIAVRSLGSGSSVASRRGSVKRAPTKSGSRMIHLFRLPLLFFYLIDSRGMYLMRA